MLSIVLTLTSCSDSYLERSNISFYENRLDSVELNGSGLDVKVQKNRLKILWFSADCIMLQLGSTISDEIFNTSRKSQILSYLF